MAPSQSQAENAVTISALITGGMYAYRYFTEGGNVQASNESRGSESYFKAYKGVYGFGPVLPLGQWVPAAGVTFLVVSIAAAASPELGTSLAALVGVGAFMGNALAVQNSLSGKGGSLAASSSISKAKAEGQKAAPVTSKNHPANALQEIPTLVEGGI